MEWTSAPISTRYPLQGRLKILGNNKFKVGIPGYFDRLISGMILVYAVSFIPPMVFLRSSKNSSHAEVPSAWASTSWDRTRVEMSAHLEAQELWVNWMLFPGSNSAYSSYLWYKEGLSIVQSNRSKVSLRTSW